LKNFYNKKKPETLTKTERE